MDLMLPLAVIGALVLLALLVHGLWTARRAGPRRAEAPPPPVAADHDGPTLDGPPPAALDEIPEPTLAPEPRIAPLRRGGRLDALIDAIAPLGLDAPLTGEAVLPHLPTTRRAGTKPFLIEGLDAETGEWAAPAAGRRYTEFQAGVQLANRHGPLNEIEYSEFVQKVQAFADQTGAAPDFPDMLDVVARARELDAFAGEHDAQLSVTLRAQGAAWSVGYIQQCAARHGFVAGAVPGRLVLPGAEDGAPPVLVLSFDAQAAMQDDPNLAAVRKLRLSLDVPQTPAAAEPFGTWQQCARSLASDMGATLTDDAGMPITLATFTTIGDDLARLYAALEGRDVAAGSAAARRLFS